jgi:hypothetical protein
MTIYSQINPSFAIVAFTNMRLIRPRSSQDGNRRLAQDLEIEPDRLLSDVPEIQANHFIERRSAAAVHLPETRYSRLGFEDPSSVPQRVFFEFIGYWRARADQGHFAAKNIEELR